MSKPALLYLVARSRGHKSFWATILVAQNAAHFLSHGIAHHVTHRGTGA